MSKPRRRYGSSEAVIAKMYGLFDSIWNKYIHVSSPPTALYHYCPYEAFCKIVRSGSLWGSDVLHMKDQTEITYALHEISGPIAAEQDENGENKYYLQGTAPPEEIRKVWSGWCTHIACLSPSMEIPSQWRDYAGGCTGCAIGFDYGALAQWCASRKLSLFAMNYDFSMQRKIVREFLEGEKAIE